MNLGVENLSKRKMGKAIREVSEEAVGIRNHECKDVYKGIRSITNHEKIIIQLILTVKAAFV